MKNIKPITVSQNGPTQRLEVVDALRGFALLAIVLLHNLEHYNIFSDNISQPDWLNSIDVFLCDAIYFLFAGKAYATFSLLFGFSFYIQMRNARKRGDDFRMRFAWRMMLLVGFSQLHALFYNGDILLLYAFCGLLLIPASSWSNRTVLTVAIILMLQPFAWGKIIYACFNPEYIDTNSMFAQFAAIAEQTGRHGNLLETLSDNIWNGQLYSNFWQVEAGRLFQTPALFLIGMWLGRKELFTDTPGNRMFWKWAMLYAVAAAIPLYFLKTYVPAHISNITMLSYYSIAIPMIYNFAFMVILMSVFVLAWYSHGNGYKFQRSVIAYGRMSLTNYITQSIIGVAIYYNFGLCLYNSAGATMSLIIGAGIFSIQLIFSRYWLGRHRQGPLEYIWKRATWISFPKQATT